MRTLAKADHHPSRVREGANGVDDIANEGWKHFLSCIRGEEVREIDSRGPRKAYFLLDGNSCLENSCPSLRAWLDNNSANHSVERKTSGPNGGAAPRGRGSNLPVRYPHGCLGVPLGEPRNRLMLVSCYGRPILSAHLSLKSSQLKNVSFHSLSCLVPQSKGRH